MGKCDGREGDKAKEEIDCSEVVMLGKDGNGYWMEMVVLWWWVILKP